MITLHLKTKYSDEDTVIEPGTYGDGSTALRLLDSETGEPVSVATVCLTDYGLKPRDGHVFVKDWSENEGMFACLVDQGIVGPPVAVHKVGFNDSCNAYEAPLLVDVQ